MRVKLNFPDDVAKDWGLPFSNWLHLVDPVRTGTIGQLAEAITAKWRAATSRTGIVLAVGGYRLAATETVDILRDDDVIDVIPDEVVALSPLVSSSSQSYHAMNGSHHKRFSKPKRLSIHHVNRSGYGLGIDDDVDVSFVEGQEERPRPISPKQKQRELLAAQHQLVQELQQQLETQPMDVTGQSPTITNSKRKLSEAEGSAKPKKKKRHDRIGKVTHTSITSTLSCLTEMASGTPDRSDPAQTPQFPQTAQIPQTTQIPQTAQIPQTQNGHQSLEEDPQDKLADLNNQSKESQDTGDEPKKKRKRRPRKNKGFDLSLPANEENKEGQAIPSVAKIPFKVPLATGNKIVFDDDGEAQEGVEDKSEGTPRISLLQNPFSESVVTDKAKAEDPDTETEEENEEAEETEESKKEKKMAEENFESWNDLKEMPQEGAIVAFKVMEMNDNYCPQISDFKVGAVKSVAKDRVVVRIFNFVKQKAKGKFEMKLKKKQVDGEDNLVTENQVKKTVPEITVVWNSVIEAKMRPVDSALPE